MAKAHKNLDNVAQLAHPKIVMRWLIVCGCCLFLPSISLAQCYPASNVCVHCPERNEIDNILALWDDVDCFSPPDPIHQTQWVVERKESNELRPLTLHVGGLEFSYGRKREVGLAASCWHLIFRPFSKIGLYCRSKF